MTETKKAAKPRGIYQGLDRSDAVKHAVLVCNSLGEWFRFKLWTDRVMIMNREEEFKDFEEFKKYGVSLNDKPAAVELYTKHFGFPPPKNAKVEQIAEAVWCKMYAKAKDRTEDYRTGGGRDVVTGKKKRKRNLDGRKYWIPDAPNAEAARETMSKLGSLPPQAKACLKIFQKELKDSDKTSLTESEVKDMVMRARDRGDMKTKQDPFRIWQYYRPTLVEAGLIKHD